MHPGGVPYRGRRRLVWVDGLAEAWAPRPGLSCAGGRPRRYPYGEADQRGSAWTVPSGGASAGPPGGRISMSRLDREVNDALQRAQADDLGRPRARFAREPEPLPDPVGWGPLSFL